MKKLLFGLIASSLVFGTLLFVNVQPTYAAANFYLSPSKATVPKGTTLTVSIRVSSAEAIDAAQANLTYPADKFDFLSINTGGGAFDIVGEKSGGGGSVRIGAFRAGAISGDKLIATVSFRAKVESGSATINFAAGTEGVNSGNPIGGGQSGGTYTFAPPPPPPPPPDTTAPKITDVKVTATSIKGATIEWKTDEASSSIVEYGLTNKYGLSAEGAGQTKDHKVTFSSDLVLPGLSYHFKVKSADAAGNTATSQDSTFKTSGYNIKVTIKDRNGKAISEAQVTLGSNAQTAKTDKNGIAEFSDVASGKQFVTVEYKGKVQGVAIEVKDATEKEITSGKIKPQSFEVKIAGASIIYDVVNLGIPLAIAILFGALLGMAAIFLWQRVKGTKSTGQRAKSKPGKIISDQIQK